MDGINVLVDAARAVLLAEDPVFLGALAWLLAVVLFFAGVTKAVRPWRFALTLTDFRIMRRPSRNAALAVAAIELGVALLIAIPATRIYAVVPATALFLAFTVLLSAAVIRGDRFPCGCFGSEDEEISLRSLLRTISLLGCSAVLTIATLHGGHGLGGTMHDLLSSALLAGLLIGIAVTATRIPTLRDLSSNWMRNYRSVFGDGS